MTIEETVAELVDANLRGCNLIHMRGIVRRTGLHDFYLAKQDRKDITGLTPHGKISTIFKYRSHKCYQYIHYGNENEVINLYQAIDIVKEHWDERFTNADWKGSV